MLQRSREIGGRAVLFASVPAGPAYRRGDAHLVRLPCRIGCGAGAVTGRGFVTCRIRSGLRQIRLWSSAQNEYPIRSCPRWNGAVGMKWIATALFLAVGGAVYFLTRNSQQQPPSRVLEDRSFVINGRPTTCGELIQQPCEFRLQTEYNRVGDRLESFLYSSALGSFATDTGFAAELGPFASDISFAAAAKLSLQACQLSDTTGKTILDFVELGRLDHPDAGSPELFAYWNRAREGLCAVGTSV